MGSLVLGEEGGRDLCEVRTEARSRCGLRFLSKVGNYLSTQVGLVQQLKNAVPVLTQPDGKKMVQKFIADDRKEIQALESAGNYQVSFLVDCDGRQR